MPEGGFYGPRDIAFGPNKQLYVIDQGLTRIAKFDPATESFTVWGSSGAGEGQFNEATNMSSDSKGNLMVADTQMPRATELP